MRLRNSMYQNYENVSQGPTGQKACSLTFAAHLGQCPSRPFGAWKWASEAVSECTFASVRSSLASSLLCCLDSMYCLSFWGSFIYNFSAESHWISLTGSSWLRFLQYRLLILFGHFFGCSKWPCLGEVLLGNLLLDSPKPPRELPRLCHSLQSSLLPSAFVIIYYHLTIRHFCIITALSIVISITICIMICFINSRNVTHLCFYSLIYYLLLLNA